MFTVLGRPVKKFIEIYDSADYCNDLFFNLFGPTGYSKRYKYRDVQVGKVCVSVVWKCNVKQGAEQGCEFNFLDERGLSEF